MNSLNLEIDLDLDFEFVFEFGILEMDWKFCIRVFFILIIYFKKKNLFWTVWAQTVQNYSGIHIINPRRFGSKPSKTIYGRFDQNRP